MAESSGASGASAAAQLLRAPDGVERDRRGRETSSLWERIASSRSEEERALLRERVVLVNLSVARAIASRYRSKGIALDDLEQVAFLGLVKAANGFDPGFGKNFLSYAVPTISGEVKRHFRDVGWTVRPPRRVQELQARIHSVSDDSAQSLGRAARPLEIAERLGAHVSDVVEALTCNGFNPLSLDLPLGEPGSSVSLGDLLPAGGSDYDRVEITIVLRAALASLSAHDLWILQRRFYDDLTQQQIGEEIGISQMQVSRRLTRILTRLRALMAPVDEDLDLSA